MDIYGKIEKYSDLTFGIDAIGQEKQALIDQVLTPEIKEKLAEIDAEFDPKVKDLSQQKSMLEADIKAEVLQARQTVREREESMSNWVSVDNQPLPDKDGLVVCWDGQEYAAFYFRIDWTVTLPFGTKCWYLVPQPLNFEAQQ